jgi:environmental stress-induced protein Ves
VHLIRLSDARREPWRNGGGWTREITRFPADSTEFDWRLSVAEVETDGPFSRFDGCDRILVLLGGNGMELQTVGQPVTLWPPHDQLRFPGELAISARLIAGPTTDLNLIWRRDRCAVVLHQIDPRAPMHIGGLPEEVVVAFTVVTGATRVSEPGEGLLVGRDEHEIAFVIAPPPTL